MDDTDSSVRMVDTIVSMLEEFAGQCFSMLKACNERIGDFKTIQGYYREAERLHREIGEYCNHFMIFLGRETTERARKLTAEDRGRYALARTLQGMNSGLMYQTQGTYREALARSQFFESQDTQANNRELLGKTKK